MLLVLTACASTGPLPAFDTTDVDLVTEPPGIRTDTPENNRQNVLALLNEELFKQGLPVEPPASLTRLNEEQERQFFSYFHAPRNAATAPYERVANYLSILLDGFNYSTSTHNASTTLEEFSGNCLSLTLLTTALADLANVDVKYQLLDANPIYELDTDYLFTSDHLRAVLKDSYRHPSEDAIFKSRRSIRIDFFTTRGLKFVDNIPLDLQTSMYYSNVAVEHLSEQRYDIAYQYARKAMELSMDNSSALNTLGILHRRKGDDQTAEELYRYGIRNFKNNNSISRNYLLLLEQQSRLDEAHALQQRVASSAQNNPWRWINAGRKAFKKGDYLGAVELYQRALSIAPDLHRLHLDTAQAYYKAGQNNNSRKHLQKAISIAAADGDRLLYQRKLAALR